MRGNVNATPFAARRFWTSVAASIATFAAACLVSGSAPAASEPASFSVKVVREVGRYDFTVTCTFRCQDFLLRVRRDGEPPVFTAAETFDDQAFVSYRFRCDGPRGVNWTITDRVSQERVSGFFRMPRCGKWRPQNVGASTARGEARRLAERAISDVYTVSGTSCARRGVGDFECRVSYFTGDTVCERGYRLRFQFRSPSFTRTLVDARGASCRNTYPG